MQCHVIILDMTGTTYTVVYKIVKLETKRKISENKENNSKEKNKNKK